MTPRKRTLLERILGLKSNDGDDDTDRIEKIERKQADLKRRDSQQKKRVSVARKRTDDAGSSVCENNDALTKTMTPTGGESVQARAARELMEAEARAEAKAHRETA